MVKHTLCLRKLTVLLNPFFSGLTLFCSVNVESDAFSPWVIVPGARTTHSFLLFEGDDDLPVDMLTSLMLISLPVPGE